ncbi:glycosyltransferase family 4 protein [Pseudanabaena mucicola]|uniref:Glycosyltransferase family 4 protein n=1 Tax=Pseudanabaena mucicola FACHB-723 TaxID=2692860 RepID=A0ABR7ZSY1_9CYAN|nr:glycosyltransferase family 4 protein [Pseudanabaena mucicola]MBD2187083.1 glycosyltransferase family 4 protein [Pseudanabaena mucicola FACHB-723]
MSNIPKVLIVATHPIQYQVPWFQALSQRNDISLDVLFLSILDAQQQGVGFGISFEWDIPLLDGYKWKVAKDYLKQTIFKGFTSQYLSKPLQLLKELQPDVVILTGWQVLPLLQLLLACKILKIPCAVRGESNSLKPRPFFISLLHQTILNLYNAFLVIGKANHSFYLKNGVPIHKLFSCPYFIDNQRFRDTSIKLMSQRQQLRDKWQISFSKVCFCYVGKLETKKRILDLLEALKNLKNSSNYDLIHILVVGTGELMELAQKFVSDHSLPVTFAGFLNQSEIVQAYVASDCLVLPSDYGETWGLVVNEAMACGLPAIVSDRVGCGLDLVESGVTGETFPFADSIALAKLLDVAISDFPKLKIMGKNAQRLVFEKYSINQLVDGTIQSVNYLLPTHSKN